MLLKIHRHYPHSILSDSVQNKIEYHWFQEDTQWLGIRKADLTDEELYLLQTLFPAQILNQNHSPAAESWRQFLAEDGAYPDHSKDADYRIIHFSLTKGDWTPYDFETAFKGFFHQSMIMFWKNKFEGAIIEEYNHHSPQSDEFEGICHAIESDFLTDLTLYIGTPQRVTKDLPRNFQHDQTIFETVKKENQAEKIFTFETLLPVILINEMPEYIQNSLLARFSFLLDDQELLTTIMFFLNNGSNASMTAKKLFIHRNTLQYRLDKFSEKTGINLKDFKQASTVYLACLYLKQSSKE
ncbi:PucR family transcriptional regulator [Cytobacillus gottheilii]|uniref:PucR family transcriptional regulator n=1 Tax=Cytobacillus gottheilii TaxID=859144 RepID=UPI0009BBD490|nr:helix-turn-helix domain-containing protein [Cytobacillus gottheilii]